MITQMCVSLEDVSNTADVCCIIMKCVSSLDYIEMRACGLHSGWIV